VIHARELALLLGVNRGTLDLAIAEDRLPGGLTTYLDRHGRRCWLLREVDAWAERNGLTPS
jgi:predicted DNA-binding transcriptional regulator AlpA